MYGGKTLQFLFLMKRVLTGGLQVAATSPPSPCLQEEEAEPHAYISVNFIIWQP